MKISRVMLIGWLTLAASVMALPQFTALIPENKLFIVTFVAGLLTLLIRWLGGQLGVEPLTLVGVAQLIASILDMTTSLVPPSAMPYITALSAIVLLIVRWKSGTDPATPDTRTGMLFRKP